MKKFIFLFLTLFFSSLISYAQTNDENSGKKSSYEEFISKTGTLVRYTEYPLPDIVKGSWKSYATSALLRKVTIGDDNKWYLNLTKERYQLSDLSVFIPSEDLTELLRATEQLEKIYESLDDIGEATYVEEKFETKDDLRIGFYIQKQVSKNGNATLKKKWFMNLNTNYRGGSNFFDTSVELKSCFQTALDAISQYSE